MQIKSQVFPNLKHVIIVNLHCFEKEKYKNSEIYFKQIDKKVTIIKQNQANLNEIKKVIQSVQQI